MKSTWLLTTILAGCCCPGLAYAQAAAAPNDSASAISQPASADSSNPLGEIVVTAQKRSERLSKVGMTITAATGAQLEQRGVTDVQALTRLEPSLQFSQSLYGTPVLTIRGVGFNNANLASSPTISVYQDEVPFPYPVMTGGALLDVQRVEVLKGPQGTLYGQNATGGAVNFIANKPSDHLEAGITASYGRFDAAHFDGYVGGPLSSTIKARVSASLDRGGAWQRSNTRDDSLGNKRKWVARGLLDWEPGTTFKASFALNAWQDRSDTLAGQNAGFYLLAPQFVSPAPPTAHIPNPAYIANGTYPAPILANLSNPVSPHDPRAADWTAGTHPRRDQKFIQPSLRMEWTLSPTIGVTSLTSFEHFTQSDFNDIVGLNSLSDITHIMGKVNSFFQELRLHGTFADGHGDWIVGLNYAHDKSAEHDDQVGYTTGSYLTATGIPWQNVLNTNLSTVETKSVFANASVPLLSTVKLRLGIRYTRSDSDLAGCTASRDAGLSNLVSGGSVTPGQCFTILPNFTSGLYRSTLNEHNVPWRAGLEWQAAPNTLLYVSASKGYKAGAATSTGATVYVQLIPIKQESVLAYEAGIKSQLLDNRISLTANVFHYDYRDKQLLGRIIDPIFGALTTLVNIPKSEEDGAEATVVLRPAGGVTLDGAVTYLRPKVKSNYPNFDPYGNPTNFKGEGFPYTPKWSMSGGARYEWSVNDSLSAFAAVRGSYQSRTVAAFGADSVDAAGAPSIRLKSYALLDMSAGLEAPGGRWRLEAWVRNLTNTYYNTTANYITDNSVRYAGQPRTYGLTIGYKIGS